MAPIKSFTLVTKHVFFSNSRQYEIHLDNQPVFWVDDSHCPRSWSSRDPLDIRRSPPGPAIASTKLKGFNADVWISVPTMSDSNVAGDAGWIKVRSPRFMGKQYAFDIGGRTFSWRRTSNKALGASLMGQDYKLIEAANPTQILAVQTTNRHFFRDIRTLAKIDWFADLPQDVELAALVAMLGIKEGLTYFSTISVAAGAAGGGGGA